MAVVWNQSNTNQQTPRRRYTLGDTLPDYETTPWSGDGGYAWDDPNYDWSSDEGYQGYTSDLQGQIDEYRRVRRDLRDKWIKGPQVRQQIRHLSGMIDDLKGQQNAEAYREWLEENPGEMAKYHMDAGPKPAPEPVDIDGDGRADYLVDVTTGEIIDDFTNVNELLTDLGEMAQNTPEFEESGLTDIQETDSWSNLQDLIGWFEQGPNASEMDQARNYAADAFGLSADEYKEMLGGLTKTLLEGPGAQEGFSEQERALREREIARETQINERRAQQMVENIQANSGSAARAYMAADQALQQIQDSEIKSRVALANEEMARQMMQYEALQQQQGQMAQLYAASKSDYLKQLSDNKAMAMQGYATQISTIMQENQQYLMRYELELKRFEASVGAMYQAVNAEIGVSEHKMQLVKDHFGMSMAKHQQQLNDLLTEYQMDMYEEQQEENERQGVWNKVLGGLEIVGGIVLAVATRGSALPASATLFAHGVSTATQSTGGSNVPSFGSGDFYNDVGSDVEETG